MSSRFAWSLLFGVAWLLAPWPVQAQEQGQPRGVPSSDEYAEQFFRTGNVKVMAHAGSVCPEESEWHRNLLERLLAPERRSEVVGHGATSFRSTLLQRCDWPPVHRWFRESLMEITDYGHLFSLASGIAESWTPGDHDVILRFAQRTDLDESTKTRVLNTISPGLPPEEKVDLFFDLFEAGALTRGYLSLAEAGLPYFETTADRFARRAATSVVEHADKPYATRIVSSMGWAVRQGPGVSRATAAAVLQAFDRLADREGFRGWVRLHREEVARVAAGGARGPGAR